MTMETHHLCMVETLPRDPWEAVGREPRLRNCPWRQLGRGWVEHPLGAQTKTLGKPLGKP